MAAKSTRPTFASAQDVADFYGISAKKVRAIWRKDVRANGGVIGKDTPGRGKRYGKDVFAAMAERVEASLASDDDAQDDGAQA